MHGSGIVAAILINSQIYANHQGTCDLLQLSASSMHYLLHENLEDVTNPVILQFYFQGSPTLRKFAVFVLIATQLAM